MVLGQRRYRYYLGLLVWLRMRCLWSRPRLGMVVEELCRMALQGRKKVVVGCRMKLVGWMELGRKLGYMECRLCFHL